MSQQSVKRQQVKEKTPLYKQWWLWIIIFIIFTALMATIECTPLNELTSDSASANAAVFSLADTGLSA